MFIAAMPLLWRHNGRDSVSNHQTHDCSLKHFFRRRSKKASKLRVTGLCVGNSPVTDEFPAQMANNAENVSIWLRHHRYKKIIVFYEEEFQPLVSFQQYRLFINDYWPDTGGRRPETVTSGYECLDLPNSCSALRRKSCDMLQGCQTIWPTPNARVYDIMYLEEKSGQRMNESTKRIFTFCSEIHM